MTAHRTYYAHRTTIQSFSYGSPAGESIGLKWSTTANPDEADDFTRGDPNALFASAVASAAERRRQVSFAWGPDIVIRIDMVEPRWAGTGSRKRSRGATR